METMKTIILVIATIIVVFSAYKLLSKAKTKFVNDGMDFVKDFTSKFVNVELFETLDSKCKIMWVNLRKTNKELGVFRVKTISELEVLSSDCGKNYKDIVRSEKRIDQNIKDVKFCLERIEVLHSFVGDIMKREERYIKLLANRTNENDEKDVDGHIVTQEIFDNCKKAKMSSNHKNATFTNEQIHKRMFDGLKGQLFESDNGYCAMIELYGDVMYLKTKEYKKLRSKAISGLHYKLRKKTK